MDGKLLKILEGSMDMKYVDDALPRRIDGWTSPILGMHMSIVTYGFAGRPLLLFPTAAADFLENERFFLVKAVEPYLMAGRVQLFSIDSINKMSWMDKTLAVGEQARRQDLYARYVEQEVVPYIRAANGDASARIGTTGASFGGFHAANTLFRRPDLFGTLIAMSGFYDLEGDYLRGYTDENCYFNNPAWYLRGLEGPYLDILRNHCSINIVTGQGAYEAPDASRALAGILGEKGIPHTLDIWGTDVSHDWPWWRKMLPYYIEKLGW
jgi:esterase/lipase superfamily enzyme